MDINEYISTRLDPQIEWYDKKSVEAQRRYKQFQVAEIILAAFIPLLSGYTSSCNLIPIIIGFLGAIIVIIESITKLYKYHENWIQYRSTCEMLLYQKHLYLTQSFPYNPNDEIIDNIFIKNVEEIMSAENRHWKSINTAEKGNSTQDAT